MVGGIALLLLGHHHRAPLGAHHDLVLGALELVHGHRALVAARGEERRLVDEIGQIGAREPGVPRAITDGLRYRPSGTLRIWT